MALQELGVPVRSTFDPEIGILTLYFGSADIYETGFRSLELDVGKKALGTHEEAEVLKIDDQPQMKSSKDVSGQTVTGLTPSLPTTEGNLWAAPEGSK